jgi:hypothetical protein
MRLLKLGVVGLAGYGAFELYERYRNRLGPVSDALAEFSSRTATATHDAAHTLGKSGAHAAGAVKDAADEVQRAAHDAADEVARDVTSDGDEAF